jgi:hypothetical protein
MNPLPKLSEDAFTSLRPSSACAIHKLVSRFRERAQHPPLDCMIVQVFKARAVVATSSPHGDQRSLNGVALNKIKSSDTRKVLQKQRQTGV